MKLCFLAPANSIHSYVWVKYFANLNHTVYWVSLDPLNGEPIPNVQFHELEGDNKNLLSLWRKIRKFKKLLSKIRPDVLHIQSAGTYGLAGLMSGFHPLVLTAWGSDILSALNSFPRKVLAKKLLQSSELITCDADHMVEAMVKLGGQRKVMHLIHFGIDVERFKSQETDQALLDIKGLSLPPRIVSLRSFYPVYDIATLIQCIPLVLREFSDASFVLIGRGPLQEALESQARELKVLDHIHFLGQLPNNDLPILLNGMEVYVSTSLSDAGLASSTAEAMACELPVVITDSGENNLWLRDGEDGFLVPVKNPEKLAEKIIWLLMDPQLRKRLGQAGRKIIVKKKNYHVEMEKMEHLYSGLTQGL